MSKFHFSFNTAAVITAVFLLAFGGIMYVWLDVGTHSLFYPLYVTGLFAAFFALPALVLMWRSPLRVKFALISTFLLFILVVRNVEWNSRKPFLRNLGDVQTGMTRPQVENIMHAYSRSPTTGVSKENIIAFRHTNEGWGDSDIGVVKFQDGRVIQVEFLAD